MARCSSRSKWLARGPSRQRATRRESIAGGPGALQAALLPSARDVALLHCRPCGSLDLTARLGVIRQTCKNSRECSHDLSDLRSDESYGDRAVVQSPETSAVSGESGGLAPATRRLVPAQSESLVGLIGHGSVAATSSTL